ncbi:DUF3025 domain-containing protein [Silvimonas iriomotensis]|uniref:DUF3025 domain-containing protein n=1 Tax=Silvimonas iriomotensis TaxID=449662 RepID=A0ABQ2P7Q6_9NEIS|nr:DUF3025 domain-containing protein [Silvimonas iriomotensis]GGP20409.1 hypothetical protein GCM10010970_15080 [Silvimonas iriomotensis]
MQQWLSGFAQFPDHPAWAALPDRPATRSGQQVSFVPSESLTDYYETEIHLRGRVATRSENWHDLFNALIWLRFPRTKAALNALHYRQMGQSAKGQRGPVRDAATLFDECGLIVPYCNPALIDLLRQHQWRDLFVTHRAQWQHEIAAVCFGHANLEALLDPFPGLTGKCWPVEVTPDWFSLPDAARWAWLDEHLARGLDADELQTPRQLPPLPYLGVPGWWPQQDDAFYADTGYFRPARHRPA